MLVDNRLVADDDDVGDTATCRDAVIARPAPIRLKIVDVVVLDQHVRAAGQINVILDVMDIVP
jgi:hypothetical protein